jgi:hypothetical protein
VKLLPRLVYWVCVVILIASPLPQIANATLAVPRALAAPTVFTFTVDTKLDLIDTDTNDGACPAGSCSLRAAIMQANVIPGQSSVTIILSSGTYALTRPLTGADGDASGDLNLTTPVSGNPSINIVGSGAATTIIDANQLDRVFLVHPGRTATISGVTIRGGYGSSLSGGGIRNEGVLTMIDSTISGNTGAFGGGIYNGSGELTLSQSTLSSNTTTSSGGGIYNVGMLTLSQSTLNGNTASNGGGIYNVGAIGTITLSQSTLNGNTAARLGGGILNDGTITLSQSTLSGNAATAGGGIFNLSSARLSVTTTMLSGNTAQDTGGGIHNDGGELTLSQSMLISNTASSGGGIENSGMFTLSQSMISRNTASYGGGIDNYGTFNLSQSALSGNTASNGGGIANWPLSTLTLSQSTLSGNAASNGGGINNGGTLYLSQSTLSGNTAYGVGGGINSFRGYLGMTNSTISGNNANTDGGGIYNSTSTANVYNTTIVFNGADFNRDGTGSAGGVYNQGGDFNLYNTLMAGNQRFATTPIYDECAGTLKAHAGNLIGTSPGAVNCMVQVVSGSWNYLNALATLGPLQNNGGPTWTHALLKGSNAIDGGIPALGCKDSSAPLVTDQRGAARVVGSVCDIGAFEYRPPLYLPLVRR